MYEVRTGPAKVITTTDSYVLAVTICRMYGPSWIKSAHGITRIGMGDATKEKNGKRVNTGLKDASPLMRSICRLMTAASR